MFTQLGVAPTQYSVRFLTPQATLRFTTIDGARSDMSADTFDDQNLFRQPEPMTQDRSTAEVQAMMRAEIADLQMQVEALQHTVKQSENAESEIKLLKQYHMVELALANMRQNIWFNGHPGGLPSLEDMMTMLEESDLFDAQWYDAKNPDLAVSGISAAEHYSRAGAYEGRDPGPEFQSMAYYTANPDVARSGWPALLHYIVAGKNESRNLSL